MNRQEYMNKLSEALKAFDDDIREEIINDYEEHFSAGLASGKTEEQIIAELGSVEELVDELNGLNGNKKVEKPGFESFAEDLTKAMGDLSRGIANFVGSFAGTVTKGAEKAGESFSNHASNFKQNAGTFTDELLKGAKSVAEKAVEKGNEFAQQVSDGYRQAYGEENIAKVEPDGITAVSENCDKIELDTDCGHVHIMECEEEIIKVSYVNNGTPSQQLAYKMKCYEKNGTFHISVKKDFSSTNFFKALVSPAIDIYLEVPKKVRKIEIDVASGTVEARNIELEKIEINGVSGAITIENCTFENADINNVSGAITMDGVTATILDLNTVSGCINALADAVKADAATVSGYLKIAGKGYEKLDCSSVSGSVNIILTEGTGFSADATSTSGRVNIAFKDTKLEPARGGKFTLGDGSTKIDASSMSGSIAIECL